MTESIIKAKISTNQEKTPAIKWIRLLLAKITIATLLLMAIGSATRVMNAGLACPDWPLCYGQLVPSAQMNLQVFLEWFHRLDAALIGLSTLVLMGLAWWNRQELPNWLPWATTGAFTLILVQGLLGGLTVTELLRFDIVTAHLATALLFFTTLVVIFTLLMPYQGTSVGGSLSWLSGIAGLFVYGQSLLGALVASRWALHQCLANSDLCLVINAHIMGIVPPTLATLILAIKASKTPGLHPLLRKLGSLGAVLVVLQIIIGVATFRLHLQIEPLTVAHQTVGATLLGTLVAFTVLAIRENTQQSTVSQLVSKKIFGVN